MNSWFAGEVPKRIVCATLPSAVSSGSIAFDEEAYGLGMDAGYEFETDTLRFTTR